jgi:hypothetical protein
MAIRMAKMEIARRHDVLPSDVANVTNRAR